MSEFKVGDRVAIVDKKYLDTNFNKAFSHAYGKVVEANDNTVTVKSPRDVLYKEDIDNVVKLDKLRYYRLVLASSAIQELEDRITGLKIEIRNNLNGK